MVLLTTITVLQTTAACDGRFPPSPSPAGVDGGSGPATSVPFTVSGTVTEYRGGALPEVSVIARPNFPPGNGVRQTLTDSNGFYRFEGLTEAVIVGASKDGFDPTGFGAFDGNRTLNLVLNRSVRIIAGEPLTATIFGDSILPYEDETGANCHDGGCLLIRVSARGRGTLTARLTWTNAATALGLFVSTGMQNGTRAFGASPLQLSAQVLDRGEVFLLVSFENAAGPDSAQLFELVTSFVDE